MKAPLLAALTALSGLGGCANNDASLSIIAMEALDPKANNCMATAMVSLIRNRGVLDVTLTQLRGYVAVPLVRNNLPLRGGAGMSGVELDAIQMNGFNVSVLLPSTVQASVPASSLKFFYASAGARLDPNGGTASFFVEVVPATLAQQLAPSVQTGMLLSVIAEVSPVGTTGGGMGTIVGGPMQFPVDLCKGCLQTNTLCPLPKGTMPSAGGCFLQQDAVTDCCTDSKGNLLCGAAAPVAM
jgi:hypothetical protein